MKPIEKYGHLGVSGSNVVDKNLNPVALHGISTDGLQWFPEFVNYEVFKYLRDEWKVEVIRLAMYIDPCWGYFDKKQELESLMRKGIDACIDLGLYVIADWHILKEGNPNVFIDDAVQFFKGIANEYKDCNNIIYELCNEPNGITWEGEIKPYCEKLIEIIREIDDDAFIIAGTPSWCQDIDIAAQNKIDAENVAYSVHFYAASHKQELRNRVIKAVEEYGLPIFVTECGICEYTGDGIIDREQAKAWHDLLDKYKISWVNWNLSDKDASASVLKPGTNPKGGWEDDELTVSGLYIKQKLLRYI